MPKNCEIRRNHIQNVQHAREAMIVNFHDAEEQMEEDSDNMPDLDIPSLEQKPDSSIVPSNDSVGLECPVVVQDGVPMKPIKQEIIDMDYPDMQVEQYDVALREVKQEVMDLEYPDEEVEQNPLAVREVEQEAVDLNNPGEGRDGSNDAQSKLIKQEIVDMDNSNAAVVEDEVELKPNVSSLMERYKKSRSVQDMLMKRERKRLEEATLVSGEQPVDSRSSSLEKKRLRQIAYRAKRKQQLESSFNLQGIVDVIGLSENRPSIKVVSDLQINGCNKEELESSTMKSSNNGVPSNSSGAKFEAVNLRALNFEGNGMFVNNSSTGSIIKSLRWKQVSSGETPTKDEVPSKAESETSAAGDFKSPIKNENEMPMSENVLTEDIKNEMPMSENVLTENIKNEMPMSENVPTEDIEIEPEQTEEEKKRQLRREKHRLKMVEYRRRRKAERLEKMRQEKAAKEANEGGTKSRRKTRSSVHQELAMLRSEVEEERRMRREKQRQRMADYRRRVKERNEIGNPTGVSSLLIRSTGEDSSSSERAQSLEAANGLLTAVKKEESKNVASSSNVNCFDEFDDDTLITF